jgi:sulfotransferase family protein
MARDGQTKAERRQARAGGPTKAKHKQAGMSGQQEDGIGLRLARIEDAVASESRRGEQLLDGLRLAKDALQAAELSSPKVSGLRLDAETVEGMDHALRLRREDVVPVREPLALICQAQRSGGTLLARLFDGHPQCHAHPHELHIGARRPHTWPQLPLDETPEVWFAKLKEEKLSLLFLKGRRKIPLKTAGRTGHESHYPLMLPPAFQRQLFLDEVERRRPIESEREVLDCYMTSLFNGWLDNQNLRGAEKRWVVAFSPRRAWGTGLKKLFDVYPDGRLISILRDPLSWFASAQGRDPEADANVLLDLWKRSAQEMLLAQRRHGERLCVVRFEELVLDTPGIMRRLAEFLGIDFDPVLTVPTFNGYPVGPNSSYETSQTGVLTEPVERYKELLSDERQEQIRSECEDLYNEALGLTERQGAS